MEWLVGTPAAAWGEPRPRHHSHFFTQNVQVRPPTTHRLPPRPAENTSFRGQAAFAADDAAAATKCQPSESRRRSGGRRSGMVSRRGQPTNAAAMHRSSCVRRGSVPDPRKTTRPYPGESFSPLGLPPQRQFSIFRAPRTPSSAPWRTILQPFPVSATVLRYHSRVLALAASLNEPWPRNRREVTTCD
jgi:hypothetical protein